MRVQFEDGPVSEQFADIPDTPKPFALMVGVKNGQINHCIAGVDSELASEWIVAGDEQIIRYFRANERSNCFLLAPKMVQFDRPE